MWSPSGRARVRGVDRHRQGVAVLVVLVVLSIAVGLSYAVMRSQSTSVQIQRNSGRATTARQAATTGMHAAIRRMHQTNWTGVDTTLTGSFGSTAGYEVTFTTGDAQIVEGSTDDVWWPYRVTLRSLGYATDPDNSAIRSTYEIEAVVQLVPRALTATLSEWTSITQHTVYQLSNDEFRIEVPATVQGPVRLQSSLQVITNNSIADGTARSQYASDLNLMRNVGYPDLRPLTGPVKFPYALNNSTMRTFLQTQLSVSTTDISSTSTSFPSSFSAPTSYRLYAGGRTYAPTTLSSIVTGSTLAAAPRTNPLGIFVRSGTVSIRSNTTIRGTVVATDRVDLEGTNILLEAVNLPDMEGATQPSRLPVAYARNLYFQPVCSASLKGAVIALEEVQAVNGDQATMSVNLTGRIALRRLRLRGRTGWNSAPWNTILSLFNLQYPLAGGQKYFPIYAWFYGYQPLPMVTIQPESASVSDHLPDLSQPIFAPAASDPGLRWELVRWLDGV